MRGLLRVFFVIPFAFVLAAIAAGLFITVALSGWGDPSRSPLPWADTVLLAFWLASMVGALSFWPAAAGILLAEFFSWRSLPGYLLGGAAVGALAHLGSGFVDLGQEEIGLGLFAAAGAVGGLVHWALAGRSAGLAQPLRNP